MEHRILGQRLLQREKKICQEGEMCTLTLSHKSCHGQKVIGVHIEYTSETYLLTSSPPQCVGWPGAWFCKYTTSGFHSSHKQWPLRNNIPVSKKILKDVGDAVWWGEGVLPYLGMAQKAADMFFLLSYLFTIHYSGHFPSPHLCWMPFRGSWLVSGMLSSKRYIWPETPMERKSVFFLQIFPIRNDHD